MKKNHKPNKASKIFKNKKIKIKTGLGRVSTQKMMKMMIKLTMTTNQMTMMIQISLSTMNKMISKMKIQVL